MKAFLVNSQRALTLRSHPGQRKSAPRKRARQRQNAASLKKQASAQGVSVPEYLAICLLEIEAIKARKRELEARLEARWRSSWR